MCVCVCVDGVDDSLVQTLQIADVDLPDGPPDDGAVLLDDGGGRAVPAVRLRHEIEPIALSEEEEVDERLNARNGQRVVRFDTYVQLADGNATRSRILDVNAFGQQIAAVRKVHEGRQVVSAGHCLQGHQRKNGGNYSLELIRMYFRPYYAELHYHQTSCVRGVPQRADKNRRMSVFTSQLVREFRDKSGPAAV